MFPQPTPDANTVVQTDTMPLFLPSFAQESLWFIDQLDPDSALYNAYLAMRMLGDLDSEALHQSLQSIVNRHEILRTTFVPVNGRPRQAIAATMNIPWAFVDLSDLPQDARMTEINRQITVSSERPFDLRQGPLIRATLYRLAPLDHVFVVNLHHSVSDRWSAGIFWREISTFYHAAVTHEPANLPELPLQYADYAAWQQQRLQGRFLEEQLRYWRDQLADAPPVLELQTDFPRPTQDTSQGAQYSFSLPADLSAALRTMAQREGVTLFMLLLAAFQALLLRYSGQDDIVVGTPVAGRTRVELEPLIGLFLNTLTLRTDLSGDPSFRELLQRVRKVCLGAYEHQELPFEKLIEDLNPERIPGYSPLFQTYFVLQNTPNERLHLDGLELQSLDLESSETKFDLVLGLWDGGTALSGDIEYRADLFAEETIAQMLRHFQALLAGMLNDPTQRLSRLPLLTAEETAQLMAMWQPPYMAASTATSFTQLFERQAAATPDAEALLWRSERLTYAELDRRANQMGHYLQQMGIAPEMRVAVCLDRTPDAMITLLGVLKAGGVYLPIDPACPPERLTYLLTDAEVPIVITQSRLQEMFAGHATRAICIEDIRDAVAQAPSAAVQRNAHPDMGAYIIYTSGSTGNPKGVIVPHRALMDRVPGVLARYKLRPSDRLLQFVALSFDVSLEEIFTPWLSGAAVVLLPEEGVPSLQEVTQLTTRYQLTVLDLPPSYWHEWVAELVYTKAALPPSLRLMILGSEAAAPATLAIWEQVTGGQVEWCNVYGLTETTLIAMSYGPDNTKGWERHATIPIGRPLANAQIYVLDEHLQPQPIGVPGELYIGGPSLARGYLNRPDLTAERFVPNPFPGQGAGERLYRTGDRVRTLHDGNLEFLGRADTQVKIRGYRIEPGEIEALLRSYPGVREAVVLALGDNNASLSASKATHLAGYVVTARPSAGLAKRLKLFLEAHLPAYMVPATLTTLQQLPRTPGGKVDRKALAALDAPTNAPVARAITYQSHIEEQVAGVWAGVLQNGPIARDDDFFKLGGHSLQATQIVSRLRDEFGVEVPVRVMYNAPTVAALSTYIAARRLDVQPPAGAPLQPSGHQGDAPLSFAQQRLWFLDQMEPGSPLYNIPSALRIQGNLDIAALEHSLQQLVQRHDALRTTFRLVDGQPVQHIQRELQLALPQINLTHLPSAEHEAALQHYLAKAANQPFDLTQGPLIRTALIQVGATDHILLLTLHHIIADGWSLSLLFQELRDLYAADHAGQTPTLPALPVTYVDYALWQRERLQGVELAEQIAFWQGQLAGAPPILELPTDFPRPAQISYQGAHVTFSLPTELSQNLQALAQREGVTLFMLLLAAFQTLLLRYSGQADFVVGTPVAGRRQRETEGLVGLFVNTLAIRADLQGDPTFRQVLTRVRETCLGAFEHEDLPFEKLVDALQLDRTLSYAPLFQVVFALQHAEQGEMAWPDLTLTALDQDSGTAKFDLSLTMTETGEALEGWLEYSTDLFQAETIVRLVRHWERLLMGIVATPDQTVNRLPLLPSAETRQLLEEWTATQRPYPANTTIQALFEAQAQATPTSIALLMGDATLTYAELNQRANQIAHALLAAGVGPETAVG
ncbi:MAG: amino acid adenylation domain-containing protein, partial [Ktedonobacterales bacterium]|nr:amino acid adenylation domain-containing protein [Ktedonobacterales bacterium]